MKGKINYFVISLFLLIVIASSYYLLDYYLIKKPFIKEINRGDFYIKYNSEPSMDDRTFETKINGDGTYVKITRFRDDIAKAKTIVGSVSKEKLIKFIKYVVINENFFQMPKRIDGDVMDGSNIYLEIRVGSKIKKVGGYQPTAASDRFNRIYIRYCHLFRD
ncbi:MAG: hypothetical protein FH751_02335 [Firmicutes bacterium]|nr:hypothetical protein [Bacillota bacterium]